MPSCPICRKPAAPRAENRAFPFCCDRCKLLDLGKWLGEEYRVPGARLGDGARPPAAADLDEDDDR